MPIFSAAGEKDDNLPSAQNAATFYRTHGADVTLEQFKGVGHTVDLKDAALRQWLKARGGPSPQPTPATTQPATRK